MALPASDTFTRADENPIGGNWTVVNFYSLQLVSNIVRGVDTNDCAAYWNADTWPDNQYAQAKVAGPDAYGHNGPAVRCATGATTFYAFTGGGDAKAHLYKFVAGTKTEIGVSSYNIVVGDVLRIEANGTSISCYLNAVFKETVTDASIASGRAGIKCYGASAAFGGVDDWEGGSLTAAGQPTTKRLGGVIHTVGASPLGYRRW